MAKLLCLGDSIMQGWDGSQIVSVPIPQKIGEVLKIEVTNQAIGGTSVNDGDKSLVSLLPTVNLSDYDYILLGYGANDWGLNRESLDALKAGLSMFSSMYQVSGSHAYVLVDLMIESFINNATSLDSPNQLGITQNQVMDVFKNWAVDHHYHYYDWREDPLVTPNNYKSLLGDGCLHPNFETQMKMAQRLADYIKPTAGDIPTKPDNPRQPDKPSNPDIPIVTPPDDYPDKPVEPDKPAIKTIDELKLDRLTDLFGIGTNVSNGVNRTLNKINELYSNLEKIMGTDAKQVKATLAVPDNSLSRPLRNYILMSFFNLETAVNEVIQLCNQNWIVDPQTGNPTLLLTLRRVEQLMTDNAYKQAVNDNWQAIEEVLNKLIQYLNQVLKGE